MLSPSKSQADRARRPLMQMAKLNKASTGSNDSKGQQKSLQHRMLHPSKGIALPLQELAKREPHFSGTYLQRVTVIVRHDYYVARMMMNVK